jgi:hypothetical protein
MFDYDISSFFGSAAPQPPRLSVLERFQQMSSNYDTLVAQAGAEPQLAQDLLTFFQGAANDTLPLAQFAQRLILGADSPQVKAVLDMFVAKGLITRAHFQAASGSNMELVSRLLGEYQRDGAFEAPILGIGMTTYALQKMAKPYIEKAGALANQAMAQMAPIPTATRQQPVAFSDNNAINLLEGDNESKSSGPLDLPLVLNSGGADRVDGSTKFPTEESILEEEDLDVQPSAVDALHEWLMIRECDCMSIAKVAAWAVMIFTAGIAYGLALLTAICIDMGRDRQVDPITLPPPDTEDL